MAKQKDRSVIDDSDLSVLKDLLNKMVQRAADQQVRRQAALTDLRSAREAHDIHKWMSAENILANNKTRTVITCSDYNKYMCEIYSNFKHDILIQAEYKDIVVAGSNFGLYCDVMVDTGYNSGYHSSDCGYYEVIRLVSDNLLTLINEASRFCTHIRMDDIPTDQLQTAVFPATLSATLLKG